MEADGYLGGGAWTVSEGDINPRSRGNPAFLLDTAAGMWQDPERTVLPAVLDR